MTDPPDPSALAARRDELLCQISALGDLRPGSLVQNYRRCGRSGCFCADRKRRGHGPYWLLTWSVKGKTRSRSIPAARVAETKAQIAECQRLRRLVAELIEVSTDLCQALLKPGSSAVTNEPACPRSKPKSTGS